ncbi:MAG: hypothetical protein IJD64_05020 [Clostridia bacterium]|nr:hypothetical protein [Clostridia bacterium]
MKNEKNVEKSKANDMSLGERVQFVVWRVVMYVIFAALAVVAAAIVVMFYLWFPVAIVKVLVTIAAVVLGGLHLTKKRRQRASFGKALSKSCTAHGYRLTLHRPFGKAFSWREGKPDVTIEANGRTYDVSLITPKNKRVKIQFEQRDLLKMIVPALISGQMAAALNLQAKVVELPLAEIAEGDSAIKILVVNPDRCEVLCKGSEGTLVSAGDGGTYFGRMVYTGKGFLKALERGDIVPQKKNFNKIDF